MNAIDPLIWSILLMVAGCGLVVLEVFIPSGGILGFLSFSAVVASIALAFYHHGPATGFVFSSVAVFLVPAIIVLAFKYWPETPFGRRFLLGLPTEEEITPDDRHSRELKDLLGRIGTAKNVMLPSGPVAIDGRTIDAVSQGMPIDPGQRVKVVDVHGNRVVVRPVEEHEPLEDETADDMLSQPIERLGLDAFDEPLG